MSHAKPHPYDLESFGEQLPSPPPAGWTDARIALLKALWGDGKSAAEIAARLGGGVSRSAVLGKVHRLKLDRAGRAAKAAQTASQERNVADQPAPAPRVPKAKPQPRPQAMKFGAGFERPGPVDADLKPLREDLWAPLDRQQLVTLVDADKGQCKWPIGDERDLKSFRFCGGAALEGKPYCATHARLARGAEPVQVRAPREGGAARPAMGGNRMLPALEGV